MNRFNDSKRSTTASSPTTSPATPAPAPFDGSTWPPPHVPDPLPPHWWREQAAKRLRFVRKVKP